MSRALLGFRAIQRSEALDWFSVGALAQKRSVKPAVRSLGSNPFSGDPLLRELTDFIDEALYFHSRLIAEKWVAGEVYEELADRLLRSQTA